MTTETNGATSTATNNITAINQIRAKKITKLTKERDQFVERLDKGAVQIEQGRAAGKNVTEWENFWMELLRQYEAVCEQLKNLHLQPIAVSSNVGSSDDTGNPTDSSQNNTL